MGWIFEKLVEIIGQIIAFLLSFFAISVIDVYKMSGSDTLDYFFAVFNGYQTVDQAQGAIGNSAGIFAGLYNLFMFSGLAVIFLGMLYSILKAFFGPLTQAEPPTKTIVKAIFFACLCGFSQTIVALIFDITQIPYDAITKNISIKDLVFSTGKHMIQSVVDINGALIGSSVVSTLLSQLDKQVFDIGVFSGIIAILLLLMIFKNMMMLILEMAERYMMIGLLTIIAPICIACGAVKAVEDVFKNWLSWMINACVVLILNTFFLCVFIFNFAAVADVPYLCLWIAWLKAGQKIDEHMNSLGLKTAKTGGFGQDVMGALIAGLPMALGAADKVGGSRLASLGNWARRGFQGKPSEGGFGLMKRDPRKGERSGSTLLSRGLDKLSGDKKLGSKMLDNVAKLDTMAASRMTRAANTAKEALGFGAGSTGHGKRSGMSHEQLQDILTGKEKPPVKGTAGYNNIMNDIMDMKAGKDGNGKSLSEELAKKGYSLTGMRQEANGDVSFSAEDKDGNKIAGIISDGEAGKNSGLIGMTGEDGQERGLAYTESGVEGKENPIGIGGMDNLPTDGLGVAAVAGSESMEQNSTLGGEKTMEGENTDAFNQADEKKDEIAQNVENGSQVEVDGQKYNLGDANENGIITGVNAKNPNDTKQFMQGEDGTLTEVSSGQGGVQFESTPTVGEGENKMSAVGGPDENNNIKMAGANGNEETFHDNGDGTVSRLGESAATSGEQRTFSANGETFTTTDASGKEGIINAVNTKTGETQQFMQDAQGNIMTANKTGDGPNAGFTAGSTVATADNVSTTPTTASVGGKDYSLASNGDGTYTGTAKDGSTATFAANGNGGLNRLEAPVSTSADMTAKDSSGTYNLTKTGSNSYTGYNAATGETATFEQGANGQMYKTSQTSTASNVGMENGVPTSATVDGKEYALSSNGNNTYTGTAADGSTRQFTASDSDPSKLSTTTSFRNTLGDPMQVSGSYCRTAQDASGNTYNLKSIGNNEYEGYGPGNTKATFKMGTDGNLVMTSAKREYDTKRGFETVSTPISDAKVSNNSNGQPESISFGSHNYSNIESIGNNQYTGKGEDGSVSRFSIDNGRVSMVQTFGYGKDGSKFQVSDTSIKNAGGLSGVSVYGQDGSVNTAYANPQTSAGGVCVKSKAGEYIRTANTTRYDENHRPSLNGNYMMSTGADGRKNFFEVETGYNNTVPTYKMKSGASIGRFESSNGNYYTAQDLTNTENESTYDKAFANRVDKTWRPSDTHSASDMAQGFYSQGKVYGIENGKDGIARTADGQYLAQRYVRMANDSQGVNEYALDMANCHFDNTGHLDIKNYPTITINDNGTLREITANELFRDSEDSSTPLQYVHGINETGGVSSLKTKGAYECTVGRSFVSGIPTDIDFSKATLRNAVSEGYSDGRMIANFPNGDRFMILPENARVDGLQGEYMYLPFNAPGNCGATSRRVFVTAMPETRLNASMHNYFGNTDVSSFNKPREVNTQESKWKTLAREYGIPNDAVNVNLIPNSNSGPIIQYSTKSNGSLKSYVISAYEFKGAKSCEEVYSPGGSSRIGYRQEVAPDANLIAMKYKKPCMKIFRK